MSEGDLVVCAVLSGNRNFEARIHGDVKANYLASPPLVVAYALAGRMDIDLLNEPLGEGDDGPVFLRDIWPTAAEVDETIASSIDGAMYRARTATSSPATSAGARSTRPTGDLFAWEPDSTYVRQPPYFDGMPREPGPVADIHGARVPRHARRLGDDRPHLARRRDPARLACRASTCSSTASSGASSTRTARGAATTR